MPFFRQFEQLKGVNIGNDAFIEYPKCYQAFDEDLFVRDFRDIDRCTEEMTANHVYLIMKTLGKFHAISLALKDQQPQKFNELASNIKDVFIRTDITLFVKYYNKVVKRTLEILNDKEDAHFFEKIENLFEKDANCLDLELIGFATFISYGDAWQNNMMFRYNKNQKPIEVCFLDWQIPCHSSPIIDIVYFMFCCTTKALRDAHYNDFLGVYHQSLSDNIQKYVIFIQYMLQNKTIRGENIE